jgi:hypothetical protein
LDTSARSETSNCNWVLPSGLINDLKDRKTHARARSPTLCQELEAIALDSWQEYTLLEISADLEEEPILLLKMTCPSTGLIHISRVPPDVESASISNSVGELGHRFRTICYSNINEQSTRSKHH